LNQSLQNEWKLNALSFAGHTAQMTAAARDQLLASKTEKTSLQIAIPAASQLSSPKTIPLPDQGSYFSKSSAQVATLVLPQAVIPKSCELKLNGEDSDASIDADDNSESIAAKRPSPLTVRASDSQKEILRRKAKTAGVSLNRYILAAALGADYRPPMTQNGQRLYWTSAVN